MKPVAWINIEDGNSILDWEKDEFAQKHYPLYDHLISELTDEEIHNLFLSFCNVGFTQVDDIGFARAILKKASEK